MAEHRTIEDQKTDEDLSLLGGTASGNATDERHDEIEGLKARCSKLEDAAFHFQTCRICKVVGEDACESGRAFAAFLRGEELAPCR